MTRYDHRYGGVVVKAVGRGPKVVNSFGAIHYGMDHRCREMQLHAPPMASARKTLQAALMCTLEFSYLASALYDEGSMHAVTGSKVFKSHYS